MTLALKLRVIANAVPCPRCPAKAGEPCRSRSGTVVWQYLHQERMNRYAPRRAAGTGERYGASHHPDEPG